MALAPIYFGLAGRMQVPGLAFRAQIAKLGVRLVKKQPWPSVFEMITSPMDSVRYFEFDFARHALKDRSIERYLDVSSPRLFPITLLALERSVIADLVNPDRRDLAVTRELARAAGYSDRCAFHQALIADSGLPASAFQAITSISVIEHIPDDARAVRVMWSLLSPGGVMVLTVPCAAEAFEEYIDINEYGLMVPDKDGFVFGQRFYDTALLEERIFSQIGEPSMSRVYGERSAGLFFANRSQKLGDPNYPFWREPFMMGRDFRYYADVAELPGIGVVGMSFTKPAG